MVDKKIRKQCGTCQYWQGEEYSGNRQCDWPRPDLPFWAYISEGMDHADWTQATDGKNCKTWQQKNQHG